MDPFARKMIHSSIAYAALLISLFAALTIVYLHLRPQCTEEIISRIESPDHKWIAEVMQRRCGDESPFITHVNLRPAGASLKFGYLSGRASEGEIFTVEQDAQAAKTTLKWTAPDRLAVECSGCIPAFISRRNEHWRDLTIAYFLNNG
jgi:hypothetical protein